MTIRLTRAQCRALEKLDKTPKTANQIGETTATLHSLTVAGYARMTGHEFGTPLYVRVRSLTGD